MPHSNRFLVSLLLLIISGSFLGKWATAQELANVTVLGAASSWPGFPDSVAQGDVIKLKVTNLSLLDKNARGKIILFLDGMPLRALYPVSRDTVGETLGFQFLRMEESKATWDVIQKFGRSTQRFKVSAGPEDGYPVSSKACLTFVFYKAANLNFVVAMLVALLVALLLLAAKSDILRDSGPQPSPAGRKSYSLGRCQMAWWFFVVFSSFVLVKLVTGELPSIPDSVLVLLGIAGGTGLGAVAIDVNKRSQATSKIPSLRNQIAALLEQQNRLKSDADGISFHRFQIFAWTALLGIIFLLSALRTLTLVDFDNSLLTLMGISAGTYLGFKLPEK